MASRISRPRSTYTKRGAPYFKTERSFIFGDLSLTEGQSIDGRSFQVVVSSPNKHKMFPISDHTREEEEFEISRPAHPGRNPKPNFPEKNEMSRAPRRWRLESPS